MENQKPLSPGLKREKGSTDKFKESSTGTEKI
jgi:hypothetical protein